MRRMALANGVDRPGSWRWTRSVGAPPKSGTNWHLASGREVTGTRSTAHPPLRCLPRRPLPSGTLIVGLQLGPKFLVDSVGLWRSEARGSGIAIWQPCGGSAPARGWETAGLQALLFKASGLRGDGVLFLPTNGFIAVGWLREVGPGSGSKLLSRYEEAWALSLGQRHLLRSPGWRDCALDHSRFSVGIESISMGGKAAGARSIRVGGGLVGARQTGRSTYRGSAPRRATTGGVLDGATPWLNFVSAPFSPGRMAMLSSTGGLRPT